MHSTPPKILAILPGFVPSTLIDVAKPLLALASKGRIQFRAALEVAVGRKALDWPDLVVFCRNCEPKYAASLEAIRHRRIPYIYDIDDNLFAIPLDTQLGRYHSAPERLDLLSAYIKDAALVRVYSNPMKVRAQELNPRVEKVIAPIDWKLISSPQQHFGNVVRIIYTTSREEDPLAYLVAPALKRILEEFSGRIEVHFWGYRPDAFKDLVGVHFWNPVSNYDHFTRQFSQAGFEIGLAPLLDSLFYRSKTNNKFREYAACRIAGIYTDVDVYSDCVTDGETGLLARSDPDAWYTAIKRLVEDDELRHKIQTRAEEYARQHYSLDNFVATWEEQIQCLLAQPVQAGSITEGSLSPQEMAVNTAKSKRTAESFITGLIRKVNRRVRLLLAGSPQAAGKYLSFQVFSWWQLIKINWFRTM